ncbi:MAG TPA: saccharopine dehydrogenase NADP-binding domain-containing protein [Allosphingosinicella sp.]|nr:saccharopine dehydrogenase NADP-binding domain-containing protein [Allosphingosinicella sp.]
MKDILLVGGGKIGAMITELLANSGDYRVTVADRSDVALGKVARRERVDTLNLDVTNQDALAQALVGKFAVLSAVPFSFTRHVADGAAAAGVHYFDLTEDVETTRHVAGLARTARSAMMPQCGLAPGFISIAGGHVARRFDELEEVRLRVGALTQYPTNGLKYNLTWSTAGLIHEYLQGCEAIVDGEMRVVEPLEGLESFTLDGVDYEAFNTSGGLGTLCGRLPARNLNYKTVRYPGHCAILRLLIRDLKLGEKPEQLVRIFDEALPLAYQDVVLIFVTAIGRIGGELKQESYAHKVYSRVDEAGRRWSGIQITTASAICAVLDLVREGALPQAGFIHHDQVDFDVFVANRFGKNFA